MEVTLQRIEPVKAVIERMQAVYGDLAGAQKALETNPSAMEGVYWFKELARDASILDESVTTTTLVEVDPASLSKLTVKRQALLATLRGLHHASVKDVAKAVGRDYKNVHDDLAILEDIGFVQSHRHGQDRIVEAFACELTIAS